MDHYDEFLKQYDEDIEREIAMGSGDFNHTMVECLAR